MILEASGDSETTARWQDGGVPQVMTFALPDRAKRPAFPELPGKFVRNPPELVSALAEASKSAADEETRYAMHRIQLRGKTGEVVATNSKELYIHAGFNFGWSNDILVSRIGAFSRPELGPVEAVEIAKTDKHVVFGVGPWTIYLGIDEAGRYPDVDMVLPKRNAATIECRFSPQDATLLQRALPRLPGKADFNKPVTLDLNGQVCVRAKSADQPQTAELVLSRSACTGGAIRLNLNRDNLTLRSPARLHRTARRQSRQAGVLPRCTAHVLDDAIGPKSRIARQQRPASHRVGRRRTATQGPPTQAGECCHVHACE